MPSRRSSKSRPTPERVREILDVLERTHPEARCALDRTIHGLDILTAILASGETGDFVTLQTTCTRPDPLPPEEARALLLPEQSA